MARGSGDGTKVGSAYVEITPKASGDFASVLDAQLGDGGSKGSLFGSAFSGGMQGAIGAGAIAVGNILADVVQSGADAAREVIGDAFGGFADSQQLMGGMEKLFGEADAQTLADNASRAFETAGMSANEYMEKATTFSASLIKSVGGDTAEAARLADVAIRAMSDNANTFGTDAEAVSNAFMGMAKGNFTMLDNLSLGYAGTQQGMLDLINDSGVLGEELTDTSQLADVGFGTMVEAIQRVQEQQGIAGTTFNEYQTTVSGSLDALGSAWDNWLAALGDPNADMSEMTDRLLGSVETAAQNALPLLENIVDGMADALPGLVAAIGPVLIPAVTDMVSSVVPAVVALAPQLLTAGMELFGGLVQACIVMLPQIAQQVAASAPLLLDGAVQFFGGLGQALGQVTPMLVDAVVYLVTHIPDIVVGAVGGIVDAGMSFFGGLVDGILGVGPDADEAATDVTQGAVDAALEASDASEAGENLTDTLMASLDFSGVQADAASAMAAATDAAAQSADGSAVGATLTATMAGSIDPAAMAEPTMDMVRQAVDAASGVDGSPIGSALSESAAAGVDTSALVGSAEQVSAAYEAMQASMAKSFSAAADAANKAASDIRAAIDIPDQTVYVNVARGYTTLPHFYMNGTFDPKTGAVPSVSVDWYAKGAIFEPNSPGIIGIGDAKVPEVAAPLDALQSMLGVGERGTTINVNLNYEAGADANRMARDVARAIERQWAAAGRR